MPPGGVARRRLLLLGQAVVTAALFVWLLNRIDRATLVTLRAVPATTLAVALGVFSLSQVCGAVRLRILLDAACRSVSPPPLLYLLRLTFIAFFAGNFLPGTVGGDVFKGVALVRRGVRLADTVSAVFVDRFSNIFVTSVLCACGIVLGAPDLLAQLAIRLDRVAEIALGGGLALLAAAVAAARSARIRGWVAGLAARAAAWSRAPGAVVGALAASFLSLASSILAQWLFCRSLGIDLGVVALAGVLCLVALVALVPVTLNGIGLQEASIVVLLTALGASQPAAVGFALLARLLVVAASLPGAILVVADRVLPWRSPARRTQA